jgi:hypothetical protein
MLKSPADRYHRFLEQQYESLAQWHVDLQARTRTRRESQLQKLLQRNAELAAQEAMLAQLEERVERPAADKPPKGAEVALFFIAPKHQREAFLGDLQEDFQECAARYGLRTAYLYCWWSVFRSSLACFGPALTRVIKEILSGS